jgi:hypothetical protein
MEYKTKTIQYSKIEQENFQTSEPIIYEILWNDVKFEFLVNWRKGSRQAVVFGTGAVEKTEHRLPIFSRNTWMQDLPCSGIWYFDPTVYLGEAKLCWGYGTNKRWYLEDISTITGKILNKLGVKRSDTLFFGSSGGGYTAAILASMLHGKTTVINPQWIILNYYIEHVKRFQETVLKPGENLLDERIRAVSLFQRESCFPLIHLIQNIQAENDMTTQLIPFLSEITAARIDCGGRLIIEFYSAEGGHGAMPGKEETLRFIGEDLERPLPDDK